MLRRRTLKPLLEAGGEIVSFMPILHMPFSGRTNLRNHRKIAIFDDEKVWAGGANIGREYISPISDDVESWKDLSFVIEGPSVSLFSEIFQSDWAFASEIKIVPSSLAIKQSSSKGISIQIVPSGPDIEGDPLYHTILSATYKAEKNLYIVTPYFVPEHTLVEAISIAAHRGVEVYVIVPEHSNSVLADLARGSYLRQLVKSGVKVLCYPTMIHAKAVLVDGELAIIGSANIDMRSLLYNFEVATLIYNKTTVNKLDQWYRQLITSCKPPPLKINIIQDSLESLARLVCASPQIQTKEIDF